MASLKKQWKKLEDKVEEYIDNPEQAGKDLREEFDKAKSKLKENLDKVEDKWKSFKKGWKNKENSNDESAQQDDTQEMAQAFVETLNPEEFDAFKTLFTTSEEQQEETVDVGDITVDNPMGEAATVVVEEGNGEEVDTIIPVSDEDIPEELVQDLGNREDAHTDL